MYNPRNWYWKDAVGNIFSSAALAKVASNDPNYEAWLEAGNLPTPWPKDDSGNQTAAALDAVLAPFGLTTGLVPVTLAELAASLVSAASAACSTLTAQIVPDITHQNAYLNAAALVGATGAPPAADPAKSVFNAMAASFAMQPQAFATLVTGVQLASLQLSTILATLEGAAKIAQSTTDLTTALTAFEASIGAFVVSLNAEGLTVTVTAPSPIKIVGLNA